MFRMFVSESSPDESSWIVRGQLQSFSGILDGRSEVLHLELDGGPVSEEHCLVLVTVGQLGRDNLGQNANFA